MTAVGWGKDLLAVGEVLAGAARGGAVPRQISVAGFDDIELAAEVSPPLTTLHIPTVDIGRRAAERLLARLSGKRVARVEEVPVDLVVRGSTGPVPGSDRTHSARGSGRSGARTGRPQKARCP